MNISTETEMLNTKQAAMLLGVSPKTIYRMEEKGLIQSIRTPGGQRRFNKKDLENYLTASKSFIAPQNPSKYKIPNQSSSFVKENTAEYSLFDASMINSSAPSITKLQQQIALRNIRSHKQHYDTGTNIFR